MSCCRDFDAHVVGAKAAPDILDIVGESGYHNVNTAMGVWVESRITATELARALSDVLNRVRYRGERFVIERDGEPVAVVAPTGPLPGITLRELAARLGDVSLPGEGFADDLEAIHKKDLADGWCRVQMPKALDRQYPNAPAEWRWQWVFPQANGSRVLPGLCSPSNRF